MIKKIIIGLFFLINLAIIICFWWLGSNSAPLLISLGRLAGLLAAYLVLWQLLLIGRIKFLEQTFGLDRLAVIHHLNGFCALLFIILHPLFLSWGYGARRGINALTQFFSFFNWESLPAAFLGTAIFLVVVIISVGMIQKKFKYETWYFIHLSLYLAIIWAFGHQQEVGRDLQNVIFAGYWNVLYFFFVAALIYYRLLLPLYHFYFQRFTIYKIVPENGGAVSIYIAGRNLKAYPVLAGQFFIVRFLNRLAWQAHPFSLSCTPNCDYLRLTVKPLGDFTTNLAEKIKVGDMIILDGPHGVFTKKRLHTNKVALLAGGIGITPLRSLAEDLSREGRDVVLLYANRQESDIILKDELANLEKVRLVNILSQDPNFAGEKGHIDEEKITRLIPDYLERDFYICGPSAMRAGVVKALKKLGVNRRQVHFEKFSF